VSGDYRTSASLSGVDLSQKSRRLSKRSIKRKKFDDELVESSLIKSDRARPRQQSTSDTRILLPGHSASVSSVVTERIDVPTPPVTVERKKIHKVCNVHTQYTCQHLGTIMLVIVYLRENLHHNTVFHIKQLSCAGVQSGLVIYSMAGIQSWEKTGCWLL